ncbi:hypothetical protein HDU93_001863 [Gonapodya sp. JEL0774]|nr:hypothetical protein HDU93_001863 [Gonapodya sp. JEL0774]
MTYRALELLALPEDESCNLLDIRCGSGLSGEVLEEEGHVWVGVDVSEAMLAVAKEREVEGDLFLQDIGTVFSFRPGTFDGAVSVSVLHQRRRAVFQFYPENPHQVELIVSSAMVAGFTGGLVVDCPNSTKAKKYFLVLNAGSSPTVNRAAPQPLGVDLQPGEEPTQIVNTSAGRRVKREKGGKGGKRKSFKDRDYILGEKELNGKRGKDTLDSKMRGGRDISNSERVGCNGGWESPVPPFFNESL